jgi:hypothetical protein
MGNGDFQTGWIIYNLKVGPGKYLLFSGNLFVILFVLFLFTMISTSLGSRDIFNLRLITRGVLPWILFSVSIIIITIYIFLFTKMNKMSQIGNIIKPRINPDFHPLGEFHSNEVQWGRNPVNFMYKKKIPAFIILITLFNIIFTYVIFLFYQFESGKKSLGGGGFFLSVFVLVLIYSISKSLLLIGSDRGNSMKILFSILSPAAIWYIYFVPV